MNEAKRICVMMARYAISGVPLAQIRLAKALAERGYDVDLVVGFVSEEYTMPKVEGVNTILLDTPQARNLLPILIKYLRRRKPDGFFTAEDHLNAIVLISAILARSKVKISASSRVTPFDTYSNRPFTKRWFLKQIMRAVMWRADVLTCVSKGMVEQYRTIFHNARHECIYNIVRTPSAQQMIIEPVDHPWFSDRALPVLVAAGQFGPWKGFTDLIRSVHILSTRRPVRLILLGDGAQRPELEALIEELGLQDNVQLEGHVANPLKYFAHADVFVLSSLLEGMPNVLIEAMMAGCTPVATDCPTGPNEILGDGRYGYLVPMSDPNALADGIEKAIINPISTEILSEALVPFEQETVVEQHLRKLKI